MIFTYNFLNTTQYFQEILHYNLSKLSNVYYTIAEIDKLYTVNEMSLLYSTVELDDLYSTTEIDDIYTILEIDGLYTVELLGE